jgi:hypothetical protein
MRRNHDLNAHFDSFVVPDPNSGCWLWSGYTSERGYAILYGRFPDGSWQKKAHRVSYERHVGVIPEGLVLDHKCRTRCCVNPAHLEPVTNEENMRRGVLFFATRTGSCRRGHSDIYFIKNRSGGTDTKCRECRRQRDSRRRRTVTA